MCIRDRFGICSKKYIPFGVSGVYNGGGGFMVGTLGDECDKIIIDTDTFEQKGRFKIIANDIFEFVRAFKPVKVDLVDYVSKDIKHKQLYKNWGEDFWRVREEKEES